MPALGKAQKAKTATPTKSKAIRERSTAMVRVRKETHSKLQRLSEELGRPMQAVLEQALDWYEQRQFAKKLKAGYARLKGDPAAFAEYAAERDEWDATSADGLDE